MTYEAGFYNEYISLGFASEYGTIYATSDGTYPSTAMTPATEPMDLPIGQTTVTVLCVGTNGLVSPLGIYDYIIGGVVEPVTFADPVVEAALRSLLQIADNQTVYTNDLWAVTEFSMPLEASTFADLAMLPELQSLYIEANGLTDQLTVLKANQKLQALSIPGYKPNEQELAVIAALPDLVYLDVSQCGLSTLNTLSGALNLQYLDLTGNTVRNLRPLAALKQLEELKLGSNAVTDLTPLTALTQLKRLDVSHNAIGTIAPLCSLTGLEALYAGYNNLQELDHLGDITGLKELDVEHNSISDVTVLATCVELTHLNIANNAVADITCLSTLNKLTYFNFANNAVLELPAFDPATPLVTIDGSYNQLTSLTALGGLKQLNNVLMDYNAGITEVAALDDCPRLVLVNIFGTQVSDVSFLLHKSIIVNFDPTV